MPKPAGAAVPHGFPFSDDFSTDKMGVQWSFYAGNEDDRQRYRYANGSLVLQARGSGPADSSPLWFVTGDQSYEIEVEIDADQDATAGLLLFYNRRLYAGLGFSARQFVMHSYGLDRPQAKPAHLGQRVFLRLRNDRHVVTYHYSTDGVTWEHYDRRMEVSGYHHNVGYDFLSLRPALYAAGRGEVRFRNFRYRALPSPSPSRFGIRSVGNGDDQRDHGDEHRDDRQSRRNPVTLQSGLEHSNQLRRIIGHSEPALDERLAGASHACL